VGLSFLPGVGRQLVSEMGGEGMEKEKWSPRSAEEWKEAPK